MGSMFTVQYSSDLPLIDRNNLPDTVNYKFHFTIKNQSPQDLYFKLVHEIPNWTPTEFSLGVVGDGTEVTFTKTVSRSKPTEDVEDSGSMTIKCYADAGYTQFLSEDSVEVHIYIEDLENFTNVSISTFDTGNDGWTLGPDVSRVNEYSVEQNGYCMRGYKYATGNNLYTFYIEKEVTISSGSKARMAFYLLTKTSCGCGGTCNYPRDCAINQVAIYINGEKIFNLPEAFIAKSVTNWIKVGVDLTPYLGQTITIKIETKGRSWWNGGVGGSYWWVYHRHYYDRVVIASKT